MCECAAPSSLLYKAGFEAGYKEASLVAARGMVHTVDITREQMREACAKACEDLAMSPELPEYDAYSIAHKIAKLIRSGGK